MKTWHTLFFLPADGEKDVGLGESGCMARFERYWQPAAHENEGFIPLRAIAR